MTRGTTRLTEKQLDVLKLLHRFHFATSDLVAQGQGGISRASANARLNSLVASGLIVKIRSGRDQVEGRSAVYTLSSEGRSRVLGHSRGGPVSPDMADLSKWLAILSLQAWLWRSLQPSPMYVNGELSTLKGIIIPKVKPHGIILSLSTNSHTFVYFSSEASPVFSTIRSLKYPLALPEGERPGSILLICETESREREVQRKMGSALANGGIMLFTSRSELLATGTPLLAAGTKVRTASFD